MPTCPKCHRLCKTAQGLSGHMRFRHQVTVPKQDFPVYARDRLEKAEDENTRLREQVARLQRQRQDQETFYEKKMAEQKTELKKEQELKLAEQQRAISKQNEEKKIESESDQQRKVAEQQRTAALKEHEERIQSERDRAEKEAVADLRKQIQDLKKRIEQLNSEEQKTCELGKSLPKIEGPGTNTKNVGDSISALENARQDLSHERNIAKGLPSLPPPPDPLHPASSVRELRRWLFRHQGKDAE
jgi:chromosome segregation ATPase